MVQAQLNKYDFIYNTAVTIHCCKDHELLFNYINNNTLINTVGFYRTCSVGKKSISIKTALLDRIHASIFTLHNVFYVLYSPANLLFKSRLEEMDVFFNNEIYKLKYNSKIIKYTPKV